MHDTWHSMQLNLTIKVGFAPCSYKSQGENIWMYTYVWPLNNFNYKDPSIFHF